jgi:hypothetical protein
MSGALHKSSMQILQHSINFAARFGFLTKDIFFEQLCHKKKSQQYFHWGKLINDGYFFQSKKLPGLIYLTPRGKRLTQFPIAPHKNLYSLSHDIIVANIFLQLEATGKLHKSWTEFELSKDPYQTCLLLGVKRIEKLPDLLVDLKSASKTVRIAIEIENTLKTKDRYYRISQNYLSMCNVSLLLYGCSSTAIECSVIAAFSDPIFLREQKTPITFSNSEFKKSHLGFEARLLDRKMPLKMMLAAALEIPTAELIENPENNWNQFRENKTEINFEKQSFSKEDQELKPARPTPAPWQSLRDHPLPTNTLREGGHEPGAGVGRGPDLTGEEELKE